MAETITPRPVRSDVLHTETLDGDYVRVRQVTPKTVLIDVGVGMLAPLLVAPVIAVVDCGIIMTTLGNGKTVRQNLVEGGKLLLTRPRSFFGNPFWVKSTALCWMVYAGTYAATNVATSTTEMKGLTSEEAKNFKLPSALVSNVGLTIIKDITLIKLIAEYVTQHATESGADPATVQKKLEEARKLRTPYLSRGAFFCRDMLTMMAAFYLGDKAASYLFENYLHDYCSKRTSRQFSNFMLPAALQPVSTVFHLFGLNYAKNPAMKASDFQTVLARDYTGSVGARICRIVPAVSIGNNINIALRDFAYRQAERSSWI